MCTNNSTQVPLQADPGHKSDSKNSQVVATHQTYCCPTTMKADCTLSREGHLGSAGNDSPGGLGPWRRSEWPKCKRLQKQKQLLCTFLQATHLDIFSPLLCQYTSSGCCKIKQKKKREINICLPEWNCKPAAPAARTRATTCARPPRSPSRGSARPQIGAHRDSPPNPLPALAATAPAALPAAHSAASLRVYDCFLQRDEYRLCSTLSAQIGDMMKISPPSVPGGLLPPFSFSLQSRPCSKLLDNT